VDLDAITHNAAVLSRHAGDRPLLAVVKANAYGTGAIPVARVLEESGVRWLGVALVEEGVQLRRAGLSAPILLLGPAAPAQCACLVEHRITPAIYSLGFLDALEGAASEAGTTLDAHLKVDSGMGRLGLGEEDIPGVLLALKRAPHVRVAGLFSNLASADDPASPQTEQQIHRFLAILEQLRRGGVDPEWVHLANSSALLAQPAAHLTLCRPGLTLFGLKPSAALPDPGLKPVLALSTQLEQVKELPPGTPVGYGATYRTPRKQRMGILPVGYADGLPRSASPGGYVLISGARCPLIGRVSMDLAAVDLTPSPGASEGDEVVLWGQAGEERLDPWDWARWTGTIAYEVMTGVGCRVARRYLKGGKVQVSVPILEQGVEKLP
jgi:alanine racemase